MKLPFLASLSTVLLTVGRTQALPEADASGEFAPDKVHAASGSGCTLSGTYAGSSDLESCSNIVISSLSVPAGKTLDLTKLKSGATITFMDTTTFGTKLWEGPLVLLSGKNLKVTGTGTLDGQGMWYWKQGQKITRPVFFRLRDVDNSKLSGFTLKDSPFRTFSIQNTNSTTLTGLTLDSSAGDGLAKNTDGFDLSYNDGVTISHNTIHNQDDCLAMQSSTNTVFSDNTCKGGHGISIGSIGGKAVDDSDTVTDLTVKNNQIINNANGLRIKTIVGMKGSVSGVKFLNNTLANVTNAIVMHSDYDKSKGGYTGSPTSDVAIKNITIAGLSGTADTLFDVDTNPSAVSSWTLSDITVEAKSKGSCKGQPSDMMCAESGGKKGSDNKEPDHKASDGAPPTSSTPISLLVVCLTVVVATI